MPIIYDKERKCWRYQFHRIIEKNRIRVNKLLPRGWSRAEAQAYDDAQTPRIVAEHTGVQRRVDSLEASVEIYMRERVPHLKSGKSVIEDLAAIHGYYAGRAVNELPDISREYASDSLARVDQHGKPDPLSPATIKKRIALVRAAARYAWKEHGIGEHDPGERVYTPQVKNERHIYEERSTVIPIIRKMNRKTRGAALIAFYSGMRLSEVKRSTFHASATGNTGFFLEDTKNGSPRIVPVHSRVLVYARKGIRCSSRYVQQQFLWATRGAGLSMHFHDLRHSAASEMINGDIDLYTVGAVLGHKSAQSTKRYAHLAQVKLREAVNKIGRQILSPTPLIKAA